MPSRTHEGNISKTVMILNLAGNLAFNHYSYEWTVIPKAGGEPMMGCGHGLRILKLQPDDTWKITHEMWSGYKPQMASEKIKR